jgi:hypothetical protein
MLTATNWDSATYYGDPPMPMPSGSGQQALLRGLTPGHMYYVGVKAYDDAANSSDLSNVASAEAMIIIATDVDDETTLLPEEFQLSQNYPNPFNPSTTISYDLPSRRNVRLSVYNTRGQLTTTLVDTEKSAGTHEVVWAGTDSGGEPVASGIYFYRLTAGDFVSARKMVLVK